MYMLSASLYMLSWVPVVFSNLALPFCRTDMRNMAMAVAAKHETLHKPGHVLGCFGWHDIIKIFWLLLACPQRLSPKGQSRQQKPSLARLKDKQSKGWENHDKPAAFL